ncbi:PP2C family protein-serine/threonine phosphatase [Deinococcus radiodurans]|uniref:PPM-type phosphatase domain-containing protein n=1 Tax=Deinococcus radiodurans (strain ATCC 13939 / DSM 20539 / JCM 16871 / CCUG 27074 / LMG 4051 / NBRC 15346 / NCIMB 9279 / VKM B-1422 / R1) TaxID=243230 RepID=Q9RYH8_DEIRA|nr:PP2C family serine/threonine-protein phosphatase [Deinococcus radiodurans]AAF12447.1 conserved hypothetical protein [Deinococcus radiodurans R1 = ATCC 13939 = DSM 20539]ANC72845.1 hypothetical protein A2G07_13340 [Deinococcus radiodurans R1 = ATCC 13939 = DSM 20539]QEM73118.1 hypothetical protein DXG80_15135 [Deinococcus radiodurans]QIP30516.1 hypothetical protein HAV23_14910 [Deinococcus radiodurans]UDL02082.1 hypothetical protein E5E91_15360 [Deinococcus radiodurans R1 = ATCC 13939 = DSM 
MNENHPRIDIQFGDDASGAAPEPAPPAPEGAPPSELPQTLVVSADPDATPEASATEADEAFTPEEKAINRFESESPAPDPEELEELAQETDAAEVPAEEPAEAAQPTEPAAAAPAEEPAPVTAPQAGVTNDLEEQVYEPSVPAQGPQPGDVLGEWTLQDDLGRGWFTARSSGEQTEGETQPQLVYVRPDPQWATLRPHRLLPRTRQAGEVQVVEPVSGEELPATLPTPQALASLGDLARLLFALEKQGYALTDLDPQQLVRGEGGLKLRQPPRVVRLGEPDPGALRDGLTAPEVLAGQAADGAAGVYLLGALLYRWLTGETPPPGGPSLIELGSLKVPGVPQLLAGMLSPAPVRTRPQELLTALTRLNAAPLPIYRVAARTTVGLNPDRPANEDSYGYWQYQMEADAEETLVLRACVCDGMGGMAAGEVASQAAVQAFLNSDKTDLPGQVWDANAAVLTAMNGRDGGCTISGVELRGTKLQLGHVGDTRAYLRMDGEVRQLTQDHSFVAAMVASGQMTPEEAQVSPERNKVLRSLGSLRQPQPDYVQTLAEPLELPVGSRVLIVTDGVWGEVEPATLNELLLGESDPQALADRLVQLSLDAGAPDNATALVIERTA